MTPYPALGALRIGCVQYLNSKPLIHDYHGPVVFDHPSRLAKGMAGGDLDAALVPVFAAFGPSSYWLVDGVAIACRGPVYSVFLAYRGPLADLRSVSVDPASLTSVHLLKVLLQEFHGLHPVYGADGEGQFLIGNQAIDFRRTAGADIHYLDLGEEWQRQTGLPFVFALWLLRRDAPAPGEAAEEFRQLKSAGLRQLPEIIRREESNGHPIAGRYLTEHIRFGLGPEEKKAIELFRELSLKHGLIAPPLGPLEYL